MVNSMEIWPFFIFDYGNQYVKDTLIQYRKHEKQTEKPTIMPSSRSPENTPNTLMLW